VNKSLGQVVEKILDEGKQLFGIVLYFWLLIGIFTVFKSLVLNDQNLIFHNCFAIINAWILAKVVLVVEHLMTAENLRHKPLIYPIIFKAAVFCMLLMGFYIGEEILVGIWRGRTIVESFPEVGGGSWKGIVVVSLILFVGLIPFFSYRELSRALGKDELHALLFRHGAIPPRR